MNGNSDDDTDGFVTLTKDDVPPVADQGEYPLTGQARVLILTAHTGAGHDSTAQAVAEALANAHPQVRVRMAHPLSEGVAARLIGADRCYDLLAAYAPRLWGFFYQATNGPWAVRCGTRLAALLAGQRLRRLLCAEQPHLVVSVHPVYAQLADQALRDWPDAPEHHCVVTDLATIHRCWAAPGVSAYYVATPVAGAGLAAVGVDATRIHVVGLPVRRAFTVDPIAPPDETSPAVLVLGGGHATRLLQRAVRSLLTCGQPLRLTVVCGANRRVRRRIERLSQGRGAVTVLGWRDDVATLMREADVVVTKAGSVTLAEACSQARPVISYHALPGQEEGNTRWLCGSGLGRHVPHMALLPAAVYDTYTHRLDADACAQGRWWRLSGARLARWLEAALVRGEHERVAVGHGCLPATARSGTMPRRERPHR